ncbi:MAG: hypothetical protein PHW76_04775 [Alphaproteobacteria bacterium]|nr:hypothetical protein [Alphaproteobacteria bacterium]
MQDKNIDSPSLREILAFFYKYRRRLILSFIVPFVIAVAISFVPSAQYVASSVLIVRLGSEYVYQPEVGSSKTSSEMPIPFQQDQIFKSEAAILASKDLHQQVIETIGIDVLFPKGRLSALTAPLKSFLISMGLWQPLEGDALDKQRLVSAIARFEKNLDIVLEKESAVIKVSFKQETPEMAAQALDRLLKMYLEKRKQLYLEPRFKFAQDQADSAQKKALSAAKALDDFKRSHQLHSLDTQRASLLAAKAEVEKQRISLDNPALDKKLAYYNQQLDDLDKQEHRFTTLSHEIQIANDEYAMAVHGVSEAKAYDDLSRERIGSVRIIQNATVSPYPLHIQPLIILAGTFISVVIAFLVAAFSEFGRSGFITPEEVERTLGLPVLAVLSEHGDHK